MLALQAAAIANCPNGAMKFDENGRLDVFYHNCKFCQHCVLICPEQAITMTAGGYLDFQKGMAMTSAKLLEQFPEDRRLFINMLMDTTIFCDCWSMTTPRLIPGYRASWPAAISWRSNRPPST